MLEFMRGHFRPWWEVCVGAGGDSSDARLGGYQNNEVELRVDCSSRVRGWWREYIYTVTHWMALQVGATLSIRGVGAHPFVVYCGTENHPLIVTDEAGAMRLDERHRWDAVDRLGVYIGPRLPGEIAVALLMRLTKEEQERFQESVARELGPRPEGVAQDWLERYDRILVNHTRAEYDRMRGIIRTEVETLDDRWNGREPIQREGLSRFQREDLV